MSEFIAVKDFERFQHYKGRTPPWIKFYNALLDDYRFLQLSDAARSQLMLIWLVASRHSNRIPNDEKYIAQAIHCTSRLQLKALVASGWLYLAAAAPVAERKQDASNALAERPQSATLEKEREVEGEIEKETATSISPAREALLGRLPEEYRHDFEAFLRGVGSFERQLSWIRSIEAHLTGMHSPHVSGELVGRCIRQFVGNGERINWRLFKRYLEVEGAPAEPHRPNRTRTAGKTLAATQLISAIRKRRNPMFPASVNADWEAGLDPYECDTAKAFGLHRILNDTNEGTLVAQLSKALEETHNQVAIA